MNSTSREEKIRSKVAEILPELDEIHDGFLRGQVIEAWVYSLSNSSFNSIDEIRASGNADSPAMKCGTQTDHIRGVTRIAMVLGDDRIYSSPAQSAMMSGSHTSLIRKIRNDGRRIALAPVIPQSDIRSTVPTPV